MYVKKFFCRLKKGKSLTKRKEKHLSLKKKNGKTYLFTTVHGRWLRLLQFCSSMTLATVFLTEGYTHHHQARSPTSMTMGEPQRNQSQVLRGMMSDLRGDRSSCFLGSLHLSPSTASFKVHSRFWSKKGQLSNLFSNYSSWLEVPSRLQSNDDNGRCSIWWGVSMVV